MADPARSEAARDPVERMGPPSRIALQDRDGDLLLTYGRQSRRRVRRVTMSFVGLAGLTVVLACWLTHLELVSSRLAVGCALLAVDGLALAAFVLLTGGTVVRVTDREVRVRHRPFFLARAYSIPIASIDQLCSVRVHGAGGVSGAFRFHVVALDPEGRRRILVPDLDRRRQARYIEQTLERRLGIVDRPVRGEIGREAATLAVRTGRVPSRQWSRLFTRFTSRAPWIRKFSREDEAMWVLMGRQKRVFKGRKRSDGASRHRDG